MTGTPAPPPTPRVPRERTPRVRAGPRIFAALACGEAFAIAVRCALGYWTLETHCAPGRHTPGPGRGAVLLAWAAPFVVIAFAASQAKTRGWDNVATGLWISVGLGALSTSAVAAIAFG